MQAKNIGLLLNRQVPVKIYYLKDYPPKQTIEQQRDKLSLPFLSSILQNQRKKQHFHRQHINDLIYPTEIGIYSSEGSKKVVKQRKIIKIARNNQILQKRTLSYMLSQSINFQPKEQISKTISKSKQSRQNIIVDQELRYSVNFNNRTLMGQQFKNLIATNKSIPKQQKQNSTNVQKNQIINRDKIRSTHLHTTLDESQNIQFVNFRTNTISREKTKTSYPVKRRRLVNSIMTKKNFKSIKNFQWSKIEESNNFLVLKALTQTSDS